MRFKKLTLSCDRASYTDSAEPLNTDPSIPTLGVTDSTEWSGNRSGAGHKPSEREHSGEGIFSRSPLRSLPCSANEYEICRSGDISVFEKLCCSFGFYIDVGHGLQTTGLRYDIKQHAFKTRRVRPIISLYKTTGAYARTNSTRPKSTRKITKKRTKIKKTVEPTRSGPTRPTSR